MLTKPKTCEGCSLYTTGKGWVPDALVESPLYLISGEAPGSQEIQQGKPFVGQAGFVLKEWGLHTVGALKLAADRKQISITNLLRCLPPMERGRPYPSGETRRLAEAHCRQYDTWTLDKAPTIILCGEMPQRYWFKEQLDAEDLVDRTAGRDTKGVAGRMGRVYLRNGTRWVFAPHPAWVLRQPALVAHLQACFQIAAAEEPRVVVESVPWDHAIHLANGPLGLDLEWWGGQIDTIGIAWEGGTKASAAPRTAESLSQLQRLLLRTPLLVGHNLVGADLHQLECEGIGLPPVPVFDTMLALHNTNPQLAGLGSYDLRSAALLMGGYQGRRFSLDWKDYEGDIFKTCREDAAAALWISQSLRRMVVRERLEATVDLAQRCAPIFAKMHDAGVRLDHAVLKQIHDHRKDKLVQVQADFQLTETRGKKKLKQVPIWRSPAVLVEFEKRFGVRPADRKRTTWQKLAKDRKLSDEGRAFAEAIISLSQGANDAHWLGKVKDDDGELSFGKLDAEGFIHPAYKIHGSPDRPIADGPNIQNFPRPSEDPRPVPLRAAVVPPQDGMVLISCDYTSLETYTQAIESGDWDRVRAIQEKRVSHENTAKLLNEAFALTLTRQQGKVVNHAFDKGESPWNLAGRLFNVQRPSRTQLATCEAIYRKMLAEYPLTAAFREKLWRDCAKNPTVVRNSFGRLLSCFSRSKYSDGDTGYAAKHNPAKLYWCSCAACAPRRERWKGAIAFLGRSAGVDITLRAMVRIWEEARLGPYSLPYIECHDELCYCVPADQAEHYASLVKAAFEEPVHEMGDIRIPAEAHWGDSWATAK